MGRLLCSSLILGILTMASTTGDAQVFKPRSGTKSATSASSDRDRPKIKSGFRRRATKARAEEDTVDDAEEAANEDRPTSRRTRVDPSDDVEADRPRSRKSSKSSTDDDVEADRPRSRKSSKSSTDDDVETDDETTRPTKAGREKPAAAPKRWDPNFVLITDDDE